jgi:CheY-like chemotaxis protein
VVLLVDDQKFVGSALSRLLAGEADIQLHCCLDGLEAVATAIQLKPTVILQDLVMPGIDGLTVLGLFRANPATAHTPVIVLSGSDDAETRAAAISAGAVDYLVKLPEKDIIVSCLRRHGGSKGGEAITVTPAEAPATASTDQPEQTLDPAVMAAFREAGPAGSADFTLMLIDQFLQEADAKVEALREAARGQDAPGVKATAHSLKGSSLIMGARRLASLCTRLEEGLADTTAGVIAPALMSAVSAELVRVRRAFAAERKTLLQPAGTAPGPASMPQATGTHS